MRAAARVPISGTPVGVAAGREYLTPALDAAFPRAAAVAADTAVAAVFRGSAAVDTAVIAANAIAAAVADVAAQTGIAAADTAGVNAIYAIRWAATGTALAVDT